MVALAVIVHDVLRLRSPQVVLAQRRQLARALGLDRQHEPLELLCYGYIMLDPSGMTETGAPAAAPAAGPGASIGKYRLVRLLGAGGMGVVWAAYDPDLERTVAIKLLHSVDSAATLRTRLLREARAMARLKHPNVLKVYEIGTDSNRDYIAMELIAIGACKRE